MKVTAERPDPFPGIDPMPDFDPPSPKALPITRGRLALPGRILVYGVEKIGKTTFAAGIPGALFLCRESGTEQLDVARLPEALAWEDVFVHLRAVREHAGLYRALVIDTLDWLEPLIHRWVCEQSPKKAHTIVEAFGGYGKGFDVAVEQVNELLAGLDRIRKEARMHIVLLAHAHVKNFANPEGDNFDRYELKMHGKASAKIKEWCDAVLFAHEPFSVATKTETGRKAPGTFGVSSGERMLFTRRSAAWDAGNRYGMPAELPLAWSAVAPFVEPVTSLSLRTAIVGLTKTLTKEQHAEVMQYLGRAGEDLQKLEEVKLWTEQLSKT